MIDTAQKRMSALHFPLPFPDGVIDAGDRVEVLWQYAGIPIAPLIRRIAVFGTITVEPVIFVDSVTLNEDAS